MVDVDASPALYNRRMLCAPSVAPKAAPTPPVSLRYPPQPPRRSRR